ncbi:hypothetical protein G6F59_014097 [Rhizopus arrhizus]|nr:hypothetical protein G6F59_014097 [Rhizopus arrhizus]
MAVDGAVDHHAVVQIEAVKQFFAGPDPAGRGQQGAQQAVLHRGQVQALAVPGGTRGRFVDVEAAVGARGRVRPVAAQHRHHSRHHFARTERLADVVVGADLQSQQAVDLLHPRGDHDHRHVAAGAQLAAQIHAIALRQHQVQQHQIGLVAREGLDHLAAIIHPFADHARRGQVVAQHGGQARFVLNDQDLRRCGGRCAGGGGAHAGSGRVMTTRSPPSGEGSAWIWPWWARTMLWLMARPSPLPPLARLRELSTR